MKKKITILSGLLLLICGSLLAQNTGGSSEDAVVAGEEDVNLLYDIQKRFGLTASVTTIKASELENVYVNNIGNVLAGRLPGLTVITSSGAPETTSTMLVRGRSSFNNSGLVCFIDGMQSSINNLNLEEIETISVLKDAAALSVFGLEGADGILYVTTKRGTEGKTKVNVNLRQGWQQATWIPELIDSYTFAGLYNEAMSNDKGVWTPYYTDEDLAAYKSGGQGVRLGDKLYPNVNWIDEVYRQFAPATSAEASFSGGNQNVRFFADMGFQNVEGLYAGTDSHRDINSNLKDEKYNFRINIDAKINDIFDLQANLAGVIRYQDRPYQGAANDIWQLCQNVPANAMPVHTERGFGGSQLYQANPVANVLETGWYSNHNRVVESGFTLGQNLDFITKGLRLEENIGLYSLHQQIQSKSKTYQTFQYTINPEGHVIFNEFGQQATEFTIANTGNGMNAMATRMKEEVTLRYNRKFGLNGISATAVFHNDTYKVENLYKPVITRGFAGRLGYSRDDRFFAEFEWSYMGKSTYNPAHNMGFFPSGSLAYIFVNDKTGKAGVNFLKLRASSGLSGLADFTTAANYYMYQQYYNTGNLTPKFNWTGATAKKGMYEYYIANPNAQWETLWRNNIGIDARFAGNRLSVTADAFYDNRTGILTSANVPAYFGILSDANINDGVVVNYGGEIAINWTDRLGDFTYTIAPNAAFARNYILNSNEAPQAYSYMTATGKTIGSPLLYIADGFYQSQEEVDALPSLLSDVRPGDIKYKDLNGDGYIDTNDRTRENGMGSSIPEITFGLVLKAGWKGLDFELDAYGMANRWVGTSNTLTYAFSNGLQNVSAYAAQNRWAYWPEQGIDTRATATYPRLTLGSNANNTASSTFWYKDGSFARISNISLGYTLPEKLTSKISLHKARIYVAATNPFVFSSMYGDPQAQANYPFMKTYKLGINLNF